MPLPSSGTLPGPGLLPGTDEAPLALSNFARILYDELEPLHYGEADSDYALAKLVNAIAAPFDLIWDLTMEVDVPWETTVDLDLAPPDFLRWLGHFKGVNVGAEGDARARIRTASGFQRGTVTAIIADAKEQLVGAKRLLVRERYPDAYTLNVTAYAEDTPDPAALERAIRAKKPAGIKLDLFVVAGWFYSTLNNAYATYADLAADVATFPDYAALRDHTP